MSRISLIFLALLHFGTFYGYSQSITGSIGGRVLDTQTAAIPNASITIAEPSKNFATTTASGPDGVFRVFGLQPGTYAITVESPGFKKLLRSDVPLDASDRVDVGSLTLEVGAVSESIEVVAEGALLQTESVERSATITQRQIENINVNGRNPLDLTKLIPGVVSTGNFSVGGINGLNNLNVNGNRGSQNQMTINGINAVDTGNNGQQSVVLSMDAIAEFKILTSSYQAEFGRSVGGQISLVTKTGTNKYHGSGYFYHRHDSLNANTYLNNLRGLPRPLFRYNDPGYNFGGPIYIPKVLNQSSDKKLFFFWSQEFQRQLSPSAARNVLVPTALERQGDFSQSIDNTARPLASLRDPLTGGTFPNRQIPVSRLYAPGVALLNLFPLPNTPQAANFNFVSQVPGSAPRREDLLRIDYNPTEKLHLFGHWINNEQPNVSPYGSFVLAQNLPLAQIANPTPGHGLAGGATLTLSPTLTNEFNWGFTHSEVLISEATEKLRRSTSGINLPVLYPNANQGGFIPAVSFNGTRITAGPTIGSSNAPFLALNDVHDISDNVTKVHNNHLFKAGMYLQRSTKRQSSFGAANGNYNFGDNPANPYDTGFGFSNALLGVFNSFTQASNYVIGNYRYWNVEGYAQDTWRVTRNFTIDYGLRLAWYQPQYDTRLQASTFDSGLWSLSKSPRLFQPAINPSTGARAALDPLTGTYGPSFNIGLQIPGSGEAFNGVCQAGTCVNKYLFRNRGPQWGPRFGFAWNVRGDGSFVIRSGGGIYYDRIQGNRIFDSVTNPPAAVSATVNQNLVTAVDPKNVFLAPPTLVMADPTGVVPTTYNYNFNIQYQLPFSLALDVAYVGTQGRHLQNNRNLNWNAFGSCYKPENQDPQRLAANPTALLGNNCKDANFLKPYIGFGNINLYEGTSTSNYNALQVSVQRRATKGLSVGLAYTWSKSLGVAGNGIASTNDNTFVRPDQYTRQALYGPTSFDRRHVLAINYVYSAPEMKNGNMILKAITNGWQLSGVTQANTGSPFTPGFSVQGAGNQNITGSATEAGRIVIIPNCDAYTHLDDPFNRLNPNCFAAPRPGSLGLESGINYLYGPGILNFDMALQKQISIKEGIRLQLRVDAFNVFNHANFTGYNSNLAFNAYPTTNGIVNAAPTLTPTALARNPNGTFNVTGFGSVTQPGAGAVGYARILQTMIRLQF